MHRFFRNWINLWVAIALNSLDSSIVQVLLHLRLPAVCIRILLLIHCLSTTAVITLYHLEQLLLVVVLNLDLLDNWLVNNLCDGLLDDNDLSLARSSLGARIQKLLLLRFLGCEALASTMGTSTSVWCHQDLIFLLGEKSARVDSTSRIEGVAKRLTITRGTWSLLDELVLQFRKN